ncbi:hypothetical protein DID74_02475 [Candidatus Marinamargulisbacteria bacterium SCGC AG-333-B06]|nr:hypothetical protein DID74_02475 [Candidatus Marinamargulisbacteria bacterium SCGC AG-333-B06]
MLITNNDFSFDIKSVNPIEINPKKNVWAPISFPKALAQYDMANDVMVINNMPEIRWFFCDKIQMI